MAFGGSGGLEGLPDFFRQGAPTADAGGALEEEGEEDLDALTFGDGFDVPLDGLPDFFLQPGGGAAQSHAAASELDDLGGITGISSGDTWQAHAAKFAALTAVQNQRQAAEAAQTAARAFDDGVLSSVLALGLDDDEEDEGLAPAAVPAAAVAHKARVPPPGLAPAGAGAATPGLAVPRGTPGLAPAGAGAATPGLAPAHHRGPPVSAPAASAPAAPPPPPAASAASFSAADLEATMLAEAAGGSGGAGRAGPNAPPPAPTAAAVAPPLPSIVAAPPVPPQAPATAPPLDAGVVLAHILTNQAMSAALTAHVQAAVISGLPPPAALAQAQDFMLQATAWGKRAPAPEAMRFWETQAAFVMGHQQRINAQLQLQQQQQQQQLRLQQQQQAQQYTYQQQTQPVPQAAAAPAQSASASQAGTATGAAAGSRVRIAKGPEDGPAGGKGRGAGRGVSAPPVPAVAPVGGSARPGAAVGAPVGASSLHAAAPATDNAPHAAVGPAPAAATPLQALHSAWAKPPAAAAAHAAAAGSSAPISGAVAAAEITASAPGAPSSPVKAPAVTPARQPQPPATPEKAPNQPAAKPATPQQHHQQRAQSERPAGQQPATSTGQAPATNAAAGASPAAKQQGPQQPQPQGSSKKQALPPSSYRAAVGPAQPQPPAAGVRILQRPPQQQQPPTQQDLGEPTASAASGMPQKDREQRDNDEDPAERRIRGSLTAAYASRLRALQRLQSSSTPASQQAGKKVTMASILSRPIPPGACGTHMAPADVRLVASLMYRNIANALDPFAECYYLFALRAKREVVAAAKSRAALSEIERAVRSGTDASAAPAASPAAPGEPAKGNAFDAVALLAAAGTASLAGAPAATAAGLAAATEGSGGAAAPSAGASKPGASAAAAKGSKGGATPAAVSLLSAAPLVSIADRNLARNLADLRRIALAKRRLWEQHNHVLGRISSSSVRTPKQALTLSASGLTTVSEIDRGTGTTGSTAISAADVDDAAWVPADAASAALWAARARIEAARALVMDLQEAARSLQAHLTSVPLAPAGTLAALRANVAKLRVALAVGLGLRSEHEGAGATPAAAGTVNSAAVLSVLSLPKGKRLLVRAVPMLLPADRVAAVTAGMRHLPHFAASENIGEAAEAADAELTGALAKWAAASAPAPPQEQSSAAAAPLLLDGGDFGSVPVPSAAAAGTALGLCAAWVAELYLAHDGPLIRALLLNPGSAAAISAVISRGEAEAERAAAAVDTAAAAADSSNGAATSAAAVAAADVAVWKAVTEALGRKFVQASEDDGASGAA